MEAIITRSVEKAALIPFTYVYQPTVESDGAWDVWNQHLPNVIYAVKFPFTGIFCYTCEWALWGVASPLWAKCEDETHTPKSGNLESSGTLKNSELDCRGQNTLHWGVLYTIGKVLKCRCPKWPRMSHLDIFSPRYGQKKGRESNWQFDSRPLKVGSRPNLDVCRRIAIWSWKALKESYKIGLDLVPIGGRGEKLWWPKVMGVQTGRVSGLHFGSLGTKNHLGVGAMEQRREYYMGEGGGFPRAWAVVSQVSPRLPVACPNTKRV